LYNRRSEVQKWQQYVSRGITRSRLATNEGTQAAIGIGAQQFSREAEA